jgi:lipopolysaccharide export system permease protein
MKILNKYVLKEHVGPLLFALTTLTSLLLLNYIAKQFGNLVGKGLSWTVIAEFFLLSIPFTVAMTLPMAVLVATLYAFSRLAAENEITALKASGVGMARLLVPVLWGAAGLAALMLAFNDQVLPRANHRLRVLQGDIARKKPTFALREQVINEVQAGRFYLRAGHLDEGSNRMREIVIYDLSVPTRRRTIYADSGNMALAPNRRDLALTLYQGYMQELDRSDPSQLQRLFYVENRIRIPNVMNSFEKSTNDDFRSDRERSICEMQGLYRDAAVNRARARFDLERALRAATSEAVGRPVPADTFVPPARGPFTLGRVYCDALALVLPKSAEAAAPPVAAAARQAPATQGAQPQAAQPQAAQPQGTEELSPRELARQRKLRLDRIRRGNQSAVPGTDPRDALVPETPVPVTPSTGTPAPLTGAAADSVDGAVLPPAPPRTAVFPARADPIAAAAALVESARVRLEDGERTMDTYEIEIQKKFALSAACIVFVLLGAPIALRFPRGGVGLVIGVSLIVFAVYYIGLIAGESIGDRNYLPPFWAMWAANILFTLVGLFLLSRMGREGSTSRGGDMGEFVDNLRSWVARGLRRFGVPVERRRRRA